MKTSIALALLLTAPLITVAARADEGRYQAIPLTSSQTSGAQQALLLDTMSGHLWLWRETAAGHGQPGARDVIYQGQLTPGLKVGEVMQHQDLPALRGGTETQAR